MKTKKDKGFPRKLGPTTELNNFKKNKYYIDSDEYTQEVLNFKKTGIASERLGELFKLHVDRYATSGSFKGYTYLEEMKGLAIIHLLKYSRGFDPNMKLKSGLPPDAFKYCTTFIYRAFLQVLQKEKKHSKLKDDLIKIYDSLNLDNCNFDILNKIIIDEEKEGI